VYDTLMFLSAGGDATTVGDAEVCAFDHATREDVCLTRHRNAV